MWREGYLNGGGTRFFVRALGHGDDVALLLHGWPETGDAWRRVAPLLVDAGYRVVCPDLKGFGRSDTPTSGYDPEALADEMAQLIRAFHVKRALVVGHDWGGAVALATAFRHPGLVHGVVLIDAPYRQIDLRRAWHIPLLNVPVLPELLTAVAARRLVAAAIHHAARIREPFTDAVVDGYASAIAARPRAWLSYYRTLSRRAVGDWAMRTVRRRVGWLPDPGTPPMLRVPALVIWGEDDPVTPVELGGRVADDLDAGLVTLAGVGHFPPEEAPLEVARAIVSFAGRATPEQGEASAAG